VGASGRQATDILLKDFAGIAPGWDEWLVEQGAIARPPTSPSNPKVSSP
jgi:hypothetical protein